MSLYKAEPIELTIPQGCPWHEAQVHYGTPNVDWCEPTMCSYINEPANTWSNLGFLLVGAVVVKKISNYVVSLFGWIVIVMGLLSALYHATNNGLTQHFDFFGMSFMMSYLLAFGTCRWLKKPKSLFTYYWFFMALNLMTLILLGILKIPIQMLMALNVLPILFIESVLFFRRDKTLKMRYFILSFLILIIAQVCAQLDLKRIYCNPENLFFHGHVLWHILCAVAMGFAALHIHEFRSRDEFRLK